MYVTKKFTLFWGGFLSQWYKVNFKLDRINFTSAEQYMMFHKALLFNDTIRAKAIMDTNDCRKQKELGRQVENFDEEIWYNAAEDIVYSGNYAKFSQNQDIKEKLFSTKGTEIVEASPYDKIWGIGLSENDPLALDKSTWKGKNLLGKILTQVRDDLIKNV
jgi:ribA/ribD-fused uncharacterized protein